MRDSLNYLNESVLGLAGSVIGRFSASPKQFNLLERHSEEQPHLAASPNRDPSCMMIAAGDGKVESLVLVKNC